MIKLMIADDDFKVRSAINLLLDQDKSCWDVVAEVRNVEELFIEVEKEKPKLLLLDWELPEQCCKEKDLSCNCLPERIKKLKLNNPNMYIIVLSSEPLVKTKALIAGANRFVSKGDPPEVFLEALYEICNEPSLMVQVEKNKKKTESRKPISLLL